MTTLKAGATRSYPMYVAFHLAKHLTNKMLGKEAAVLREQYKESVYVPQEATLMNHDNPSRRIALYDVLGNKEAVQEFFLRVPLKAFVGDMTIYDRHVAEKSTPSAPSPSEDDVAQAPPARAGKHIARVPEQKSE